MTKHRVCKDCKAEGVETVRPAPQPGPRCQTHHRARKYAVRAASHAAYVLKTYGITGEEYQAIYVSQGSRCYLCRIATGATRNLSVDHDHALAREHGHAEPVRRKQREIACRDCVRGLLCGVCNRLVGFFRDDPDAFERAAEYLRHPPAREVLGDG